MSADEQVPEGIDASVATAARMYDYYLGGHNNFAADRIAALKVAERAPNAPLVARSNRAFLGRAVRFLAAEAGIRQFLDLGTGLPTRGNVHQVAQAAAPGARVVYVDSDPMVFVHSRALKTGDHAAVIHADLRDAATILNHPGTQRLIDFRQPLAVLFLAVLNYVPDPDAYQSVAAYISVASAGSYLVVSHGVGEPNPEAADRFTAVMAGTPNPASVRTRQEVLRFFDGLDLLEPGLVPVHQWRPDDPSAAGPAGNWMIGGVGRVRDDHVPVPVTEAPAWQAPQQPTARTAGQQPAAPPASEPAPLGIDITKATAARMYDYWLGGHNNFAADRVAALKLTELEPEIPLQARENRAFLQRAVRFLTAEAGIRQFLDLGAGLPTKGNVHQVAEAIAPEARVVYVDSDPMVFIHSRALKTGDHAAVIQADLRDVDGVLEHEDTRRLIDLSQPLAVLFLAVLHFVPDPDAYQTVAAYISAAAPGSYLVVSHGCSDPDPGIAASGTARWAALALRTRAGIAQFFDGLEILDPGLVPTWQWRPGQAPAASPGKEWSLAGVGRKPA